MIMTTMVARPYCDTLLVRKYFRWDDFCRFLRYFDSLFSLRTSALVSFVLFCLYLRPFCFTARSVLPYRDNSFKRSRPVA